jgi:oxygen-independent coproporphyrinogen-3 oxidase
MGLRLTEGVSLDTIRRNYGVDIADRYHDEMIRLLEAGLIEVDGDRLRLTESGLPLSNEVFLVFV